MIPHDEVDDRLPDLSLLHIDAEACPASTEVDDLLDAGEWTSVSEPEAPDNGRRQLSERSLPVGGAVHSRVVEGNEGAFAGPADVHLNGREPRVNGSLYRRS